MRLALSRSTFALLTLPLAVLGEVRVEIFEFPTRGEAVVETFGGNDSDKGKDDGGSEQSWAQLPPNKTDEYAGAAFGFAAITNKYTASGVRTDRSRPFLLRATATITLPPGEHTLHLRALGGSRLAWDGAFVVETPLHKAKGGDVEPVPDQAKSQLVASMPLLPPGHIERQTKIVSDGQPHTVMLESFVGGRGIRPELGELSVSVSGDGKTWAFLSDQPAASATTPAAWRAFAAAQREHVRLLNAERRRNADEDAYWRHRHELARQSAPTAPIVPEIRNPKSEIRNPIDAFIEEKLAAHPVQPSALSADAAFLRRATLDTIGLPPTVEESRAFLADPAGNKRARAIERLLADPRWADHWTSYWQDVLAENPAMLKATLNNTGPFRWWIHDSLADNTPVDRFATALIAMEGSANYGGPAGFGIATQNDLPMAAKAQIVASAFLADEMKCARCHDAPYHPFDQRDLFAIAAMLERGPIKVPGSSLTPGLTQNSKVTVSLKAGQMIDPHWPLASPAEPLPGVIRRPGDSRELLAATLTDPRNERFAQVAVNRLWARLLGFGIIDPVDDWASAAPSHPELLAWLGRELATHDYDLKHIARLILSSAAYQRAPSAEGSRPVKSTERLFAAPARRRMTAEQIIDSAFAVTGVDFDVEPLTFDPEVRQAAKDHGNLGTPRRAWEFAGLANERDRPALAKPRGSTIADVLTTFGWRESRSEPRSTRDHDANVLQPALLANGTLSARLTRLTDDHAITALALKAQPAGDFVRAAFLRVLSREPTPAEFTKLIALIEPGYESRLTGAPPAPPRPRNTKAVSWANHLNPDATNTILEIERDVKAGPTPTPQLTTDWRDRAEDMLWALMLSPEFIHLP